MQQQLTIIRATRGWRGINFKELIHYKDLLWFLDCAGHQSQVCAICFGCKLGSDSTAFFDTSVFTVIFGSSSQNQTPMGYPIFYSAL
jgi:hypothetical protein